MSFQVEVAAEIAAVTQHIQKVEMETRSLIQKVAELTEVIGQEPELISQELADAITALKAQVAVVDELVPDLVPAEPPVEAFPDTLPVDPPQT